MRLWASYSLGALIFSCENIDNYSAYLFGMLEESNE